MSQLVDDLAAARAMVAEKWGKGAWRDNPCALDAVYQACDSDDARDKARTALQMALTGGFSFVTDFNDHPNTTQADVLALYDRALAAATPRTME